MIKKAYLHWKKMFEIKLQHRREVKLKDFIE